MISLHCYIKGVLYVVKTQLSSGVSELAPRELTAAELRRQVFAVHPIPAKANPRFRPEAALG